MTMGEPLVDNFEWFGETALANDVRHLLETGMRVAQEALTGDRLSEAVRAHVAHTSDSRAERT